MAACPPCEGPTNWCASFNPPNFCCRAPGILAEAADLKKKEREKEGKEKKGSLSRPRLCDFLLPASTPHLRTASSRAVRGGKGGGEGGEGGDSK